MRYYCKKCGSEFTPGAGISLALPDHQLCQLCGAVGIKTIPDYETPEQYEKRTGEPWPDDGPVFYSFLAGVWGCSDLSHAKDLIKRFDEFNVKVVCANGPKAPDDNWRPG